MTTFKALELRGKKKEELLRQLYDLKKDLQILRVAKVIVDVSAKLGKIYTVRKSVSPVLTVIK